jgi:pimeloyl-ACP methyl ester carboxylesterase
VFLQHFRGTLDNWDPQLVDAIAADREVILLDNTGVGLSSGQVPRTVTEMARDAIAFLDNAANNGLDDVLHIFFDITEGNDRPNGPDVAQRQYDAIVEWGIPDVSRLNRLAGITQPTLVTNGANDRMIPTINSQILAGHIPNARLRIFPDAAHGFLFQYPTEFAELVNQFLDAA